MNFLTKGASKDFQDLHRWQVSIAISVSEQSGGLSIEN